LLDTARRDIVLAAIRELCSHRNWLLLAAHIRSNHAHVVVRASMPAERVLNDIKAYASRHLNQAGLDQPDRIRWTRHGSTRYLWDPRSAEAAVHYVLFQQGEAMSVYDGRSSLRELLSYFEGAWDEVVR
jgi:REP element-mobilizing transposase RayT